MRCPSRALENVCAALPPQRGETGSSLRRCWDRVRRVFASPKRKTTCLRPPAEPLEGERRASLRFSTRRRCTWAPIRLAAAESRWEAELQDVSRDGIALVLAHPLRLGTFLCVYPDRRGCPLRSQVVRVVTLRAQRRYLVGCRLSRRLTEDELEALL